jgi:hypothetical protein
MRPCKAFGFEPSTLDGHASMSTRSSISPLGFRSPVAPHRSLPSTPRVPPRDTAVLTSDLQPLEPPVTGRRSRATGRRISPLQSALTQKCVCNSFGMCTYKSLDLKSRRMNSYKKYRGVGVVCLLQTQDLSLIFHSERRTNHKSLHLKCPAMNSYKKYRREEGLSTPRFQPSTFSARPLRGGVKKCSGDARSGEANGSDILKGFSE